MRALASSFVSGGDDYLFLLFDGSCQVRATTSPATALAAAAAMIVALLLSACTCSAAHACPSPVALTGCGLLLHARSSVAAGAAGNKWQIQKWISPTVWASTARGLLFLVRCVLTGRLVLHHGDTTSAHGYTAVRLFGIKFMGKYVVLEGRN